MTKKYDYAVFIGRFQPFHYGHLEIVKRSLDKAEKLIIVLGSHDSARTTRNPFTTEERIVEISHSVSLSQLKNIIFTTVKDHMYNDPRWLAEVQENVQKKIDEDWKSLISSPKIALSGLEKDHTSYYVNSFPQWASIPLTPPTEFISATDIRKKIFENQFEEITEMPKESVEYIQDLIELNKQTWDILQHNYEHEKDYEKKWGKGPHVTADACVVQAGHILLITRGQEYGYMNLALPGGFINPSETIEDAILRELDEETKLKVPKKVLRGCIEKIEVFDDPYRSLRSRLITHCALIKLTNVGPLPKVKGSDDAIKAEWIPIADIPALRSQFFDDHYHIISKLLGI